MNHRSLYLFVLVLLTSLALLTVSWLIGTLFGGVWGPLLAGVGGTVGAGIGGEVGHYKGFFEAKWDSLVIRGPIIGFGLVGLIASMIGVHGVVIALSAVLGAGVGVLVSRYILRFFVHDPPLSIK